MKVAKKEIGECRGFGSRSGRRDQGLEVGVQGANPLDDLDFVSGFLPEESLQVFSQWTMLKVVNGNF